MLFLLGFLVCLGVSECQEFSTNIIGGQDAAEGEFPHIVSIRGADLEHFCGGSMLDNRHILTAAHCVQDITNPSEISIQYGTNKISADYRNNAWVQSIVYHPEYNTIGYYPLLNDVAVITLKGRGIPYTNVTRPIKLPRSMSGTPLDKPSQLAGWGDTVSGQNSAAEYLQKIDLQIYNDFVCEDFYRPQTYHPWTPYQICAGIENNLAGSCMGDSGGPLTIGNVQYGIVSWGTKPLCASGYPGVFTRVTLYVDWILAQMRN